MIRSNGMLARTVNIREPVAGQRLLNRLLHETGYLAYPTCPQVFEIACVCFGWVTPQA
jgi:hypothetical protein